MNKTSTGPASSITAATFAARLWRKPQRSRALMVGALGGVVFIAFLSLILSGRAAILVLDKPSQHFIYPFTIQN
jgi:hypothetical protein